MFYIKCIIHHSIVHWNYQINALVISLLKTPDAFSIKYGCCALVIKRLNEKLYSYAKYETARNEQFYTFVAESTVRIKTCGIAVFQFLADIFKSGNLVRDH